MYTYKTFDYWTLKIEWAVWAEAHFQDIALDFSLEADADELLLDFITFRNADHTFLILWALGLENWVNISFAVVVGLIVGIVIGRSTEYYTSQSYKPTQRLG